MPLNSKFNKKEEEPSKIKTSAKLFLLYITF